MKTTNVLTDRESARLLRVAARLMTLAAEIEEAVGTESEAKAPAPRKRRRRKAKAASKRPTTRAGREAARLARGTVRRRRPKTYPPAALSEADEQRAADLTQQHTTDTTAAAGA